MKAVILAGGEGTRLRPLTLTTPKPVVPVVDRPFLRHQLDLLAGAGVREVVFSVAYRPERVEAVFGDGSAFGVRIRYAVEDVAARHRRRRAQRAAAPRRAHDRAERRRPHRRRPRRGRGPSRRARAPRPRSCSRRCRTRRPTASSRRTPTGASGASSRSPRPEQITTNTINAGIYVLETRVLDLMPAGVNYSIERGFFPALLARGRPRPRAGSPRVLDRHRHAGEVPPGPPRHPEPPLPRRAWTGRPAPRASSTRPRACRRARSSTGTSTSARDARSRPGRGSAPTPSSWPTCASGPAPTCATASCGGASRRAPDCEVQGSLIGPGVRLGRSSVLRNAVLGEGSVVSDFSRTL